MKSNCNILSVQRQYEIRDKIKKDRIFTILPRAMKQAKLDMWLILAGECNEDPVFSTLVLSNITNASRLTCIVFTLDDNEEFGAYSINKPNRELARFYEQLPYTAKDQWLVISEFIKKKKPERIGINISKASSLGSGLTKALYDQLVENLGDFAERLTDADLLSVLWLEERTEDELAMYPAVYDITTNVMSRAFSREALTPGLTTTTELEWWCVQQFQEMGLPLCFRPTINFQRRGEESSMMTGVIRHGDLLHYDAGISYLGLCTDLQRLAYVLFPNENQAPPSLIEGFKRGHRFGELVAQEFIAGRTGNEIFQAAKLAAAAEKLEATLYTHPIGLHCHGAGPTIGLYDRQTNIPVRGDRKLHKNTAYALEYNVSTPIPEWDGQHVYFYLEETVIYRRDKQLTYLDNQWNKLILI